MTAEIGVMNRLGVALAADSAVTIGGEARKVFSSADKLFQLSTAAPVGIMTYGNASFLNLPWEMIIKVFRGTLAGATRDTLQGYADAFLYFITQNSPPFTSDVEDEAAKRLIAMLYIDLREQIRQAIDKAAEAENGLTEQQLEDIVNQEIQTRYDQVAQRDLLSSFAESDAEALRVAFDSVIKEVLSEVFESLPMASGAREQLEAVAGHCLCRDYMGPFVSGIVIAGFGDQEFLPGILHYRIEERVRGKLRATLFRASHIDAENNALIVPFAQSDAAATFLEGVAPQLGTEMQISVQALFDGTKDAILEDLAGSNPDSAADLRARLDPVLADILKNLFDGWRDMRRRFWAPVLEMIAALPKDELAAAAEALVNLTKFRRRVTPVHESVGGPIDVALITKGDGFVWVKRKHYFAPDLNPRAIARLSKGL